MQFIVKKSEDGTEIYQDRSLTSTHHHLHSSCMSSLPEIVYAHTKVITRYVLISSIIVSKVAIVVLVTLSCIALCYPMDCSLRGSSVHGIFQARIQEWVAITDC